MLLCDEFCVSLWYKNTLVLYNINKFCSIFFFFRKYIVFLQTLKYGVIALNRSISI
jgi:hypothetical protein